MSVSLLHKVFTRVYLDRIGDIYMHSTGHDRSTQQQMWPKTAQCHKAALAQVSIHQSFYCISTAEGNECLFVLVSEIRESGLVVLRCDCVKDTAVIGIDLSLISRLCDRRCCVCNIKHQRVSLVQSMQCICYPENAFKHTTCAVSIQESTLHTARSSFSVMTSRQSHQHTALLDLIRCYIQICVNNAAQQFYSDDAEVHTCHK